MSLNFTIPAASRKPLIVDGVTKRYGQGAPVIDALTRTFEPGTATGLVGPNGSGKTTLLRLLSAVAFPSSGRVLYGEVDIHQHPYRYLQHVGLVYAEAALPQHLTAVEVLEWIVRDRDLWDAHAPDRIDALLDQVQLDERRNNLIGTYSSGMLQKAQVAAALIHRPAVLLLDEPFRALDAASTEALWAMFKAYKETGGVLIISSHAHPLLDPLCDAFIHLQRA